MPRVLGMSVFGAKGRSSAWVVGVVALALCFGSAELGVASKGKYKSLDRLKVGLKSVRTAKELAKGKLKQLLIEQQRLNEQKSYVKVYAAEAEAVKYAENVRPEVQELADRVLKPTPPNVASLKRRLHQQLADGEIKLLGELLVGKRAVLTAKDVEEAIDNLPSIDKFRSAVGAAKPTTKRQLAEKAAEPEDSDRDRKDEVSDQIEFLKKKIAKCERDEKHIRAEIRVVTTLGDQDVPVQSKRTELQRPVEGRLSSGFGMRVHPILHEERMHKGVDFAGPYGTPVKSAAQGRVTFAGPMNGYGNIVIIEHRPGFETAYGHLSAVNVEVGDRVGAGFKVGEIGSSGLSTGPHLHFEVRVNGQQVDPADYL